MALTFTPDPDLTPQEQMIAILVRQDELANRAGDPDADAEYEQLAEEVVRLDARIRGINGATSAPPAAPEPANQEPAADSAPEPKPETQAPEQQAQSPAEFGDPALEEARRQLDVAKACVADLTKHEMELAALTITDPTASADYGQAVADRVAAEANVVRIEQAIHVIRMRISEEERARQRADQAAHRARVKSMLEERIRIARKIERQALAIVTSWRELVSICDRTYIAWPNGPPPQKFALGNAELVELMAAELYRVGGTPIVTGRSILDRVVPTLPSPRPPQIQLRDQPEKSHRLPRRWGSRIEPRAPPWRENDDRPTGNTNDQRRRSTRTARRGLFGPSLA